MYWYYSVIIWKDIPDSGCCDSKLWYWSCEAGNDRCYFTYDIMLLLQV